MAERLFLGIRPPEGVLAALAGTQETLRGALARHAGLCRWIRPESLHMTLHFLGDATAAQREALLARLARATFPAACAQTLDRFVLFPSARHARVGGIGRTPAEPGLEALVGQLDALVTEVGFTTEARPYHPHVSLVRFKAALRLPDEAPLFDAPAVVFPVAAVTLYRSSLSKEGSRYEILGEYNLAPAPQSC